MGADFPLLLEERLLLLCVTGSRTDARIRALAPQPMNLARVVAMSEQENASALVRRRLRRVIGDGHPITLALEPYAGLSDFQMSLLQERFLGSVQMLREHGIETVALKGAAIAVAVHGSFVERPMGDVDLLVRIDQLDRAAELLLDFGWIWHPHTPGVASYAPHHHAKPLADPTGSGRGLELHRSLFPTGHPFALTPERVLQDSTLVRMENVDVRVPCVTHRLLHTCLHFAWSNTLNSGAWRTFHDLDAMITKERVDWDDFLRQAALNKARSSCYWPLRLASNLADVDVPASVLAALAPRRLVLPRRVLERHLIAGLLTSKRACPSVRLTKVLWKAAVRPGLEDHRGILPWDANDPGTAGGSGGHDVSAGSTNGRAMRLASWIEYGRTLLG